MNRLRNVWRAFKRDMTPPRLRLRRRGRVAEHRHAPELESLEALIFDPDLAELRDWYVSQIASAYAIPSEFFK